MAAARRVVLDTNTILSALLFEHGRLVPLRNAWQAGALTPLLCTPTVEELLRVLAYPKFRLAPADREELLAWLRQKPFIKSWPGILLVHAGLSPTWKDPVAELSGLDPEVRHPSIDVVTRIRWCNEKGEMPIPETDPPRVPGYRPWHEILAGRFKETIVFGHWARPGLVKRPGFRSLDSGCVWGGRLTAWIAEDDTFVSVPAARQYSAYSGA